MQTDGGFLKMKMWWKIALRRNGKNLLIVIPFSCQKCGTCCTVGAYLTAGKADMEAVMKHLSMSFEEIKQNFLSPMPKREDKCVFLSKENLCLIQSVKPEGCSLFPVMTDFAPTPEGFCPAYKSFTRIFNAVHGRSRLWHAEKECSEDMIMPVPTLTKSEFNHFFLKLKKLGLSETEIDSFRKANLKPGD
jgi:Fe-S-cluster containining protein